MQLQCDDAKLAGIRIAKNLRSPPLSLLTFDDVNSSVFVLDDQSATALGSGARIAMVAV